MIDNRGLTVLAQATLEEWADHLLAKGSTSVFTMPDLMSLPVFIEKSLQEAYKRGFQDCLGKKIVIESDEDGKHAD